MAKRDNVLLELSGKARQLIDKIISRRRMGKKDLVQALIENLAAMPESVQDVFLGSVPADMRGEYMERTIAYFRECLSVPETAPYADVTPRRPEGPANRKSNEHGSKQNAGRP